MKKGEFDLTGKAIDCSDLPALGDAGKEIFRALKVVCNGRIYEGLADFDSLMDDHSSLVKNEDGHIQFFTDHEIEVFENDLIQPSDVLGQAAIDAAMDGATLVFDGDIIPRHSHSIYYDDGKVMRGCNTTQYTVDNRSYTVDKIAYKLPDEKPRHQVPPIESRVLAEKVGSTHVSTAFRVDMESMTADRAPEYDFIVESEKMGFKELCPVCSPKEWQDREAETYDELRDVHLDLVRENMLLVKENESLAQRIKNLHRAINDAKACLDE